MNEGRSVRAARAARLDRRTAVLLQRSALWVVISVASLEGQAPVTLEDLRQLPSTPWLGISPDGSRVAYLLNAAAASDLWVVPSSGGPPVQVTHGAAVRAVAGWNPRGDQLAFLATEGELATLWVVRPGSVPRVGCRAPRGVRAPGWMPDGMQLTFAAPAETRPPPAGTLPDSGPAASGEAVFLCDVRSGEVRQVTSKGYHGLDFSWAPRGNRLAISVQDRPGFYEGLERDLLLVDGRTGEATPLVTRPGVDRSPMWSPDGTQIAFISGFGRSGLLPNLGIAVIGPADASPGDIGAAHDRGGFFEGPYLHGWSPDGQAILYSVMDGMTSPLFRVSAAGDDFGRVPVPSGEGEATYQYSLARDGGSLAFKVSSTNQPPEIFTLRLGESAAVRVTRLHAGLASRGVPAAEHIRWTAPDSTIIEGLLLRPPASAGAGPHPLVTILHGGPASAYSLGYPGLAFFNPYQDLLLAARGYAVLLPNPRGSGGYGERFRSAARRDWGSGPAADVQAGIDHLIAEGVADSTRLGLMGWSYGGYLAAWMLAHSDRFAVGSVGAGVIDLTSHYGQGAPQLEEYFGGPPWRLPGLYRQQSPIHHVARVRTPTMIFHGVDDNAVSIAQSELLLAALRVEDVPTELVRYPNEGHSLRQAASQDDSWARLLSWLERWIGTDRRQRVVEAGTPPGAFHDDVTSLDGILKAYYDVISGPAGSAPDRARDARLHHPEALVAITGTGADQTRSIRTMTLDDYHEAFGGRRATGFFEREVHRQVQRFGNIAHVWSTYAASREPGGTPFARGINSIQLYHDGHRWWITSWVFDSERRDNPIPTEYLPRGP